MSPNNPADPNRGPTNNQNAAAWREIEKLEFQPPTVTTTSPTEELSHISQSETINNSPPADRLDTNDINSNHSKIDTEQQSLQQEPFMYQELERIAKLANVSKDSQLAKNINLKIRYDQYQKCKQQIEEMEAYQQTGAEGNLISPNVFEDLDTAKRELEEAMYLADPKMIRLDAEHERHDLKDLAVYGPPPAEDGTVEASKRQALYRAKVEGNFEKRQIVYEEMRAIEAEKFTQRMDNIIQNVEHTKEYDLYRTNAMKENTPLTLEQRRRGCEGAGRYGLFGQNHIIDINNIDWTLYPHRPRTNNQINDESQNKHQVELGDTKIKLKEKDFDESYMERAEDLQRELDRIIPELSELYARNRRLLVGKDNKEQFQKLKEEYNEKLDQYLEAKSKAEYEQQKKILFEELGDRIEELSVEITQELEVFCDNDPNNTTKTQEEVDAERTRLLQEKQEQLNTEYLDEVAAIREEVNAKFVEEYIAEMQNLERETINKLNKGTACRNIVHSVINNKKVKRALMIAGAVGLAATGIGVLAAGTMTIGLSFSLGGVAHGIIKGGLTGTLMSRQDASKSAINNFMDENEIRDKLTQLDILDSDNPDVANVGHWIIEEYQKSNVADHKDNQKRTAIAAGIGAAVGALMNNIQINNVSQTTTSEQVQVGSTPDSYHIDTSQINVHQGSGMSEVFTDLGGDPNNLQQAINMAQQYDASYGMVPGSNGEIAGAGGAIGSFAHTYPGTIDTWPTAARSYIEQVAQQWASAGLIPADKIAGTAIYSTIENTTINYIPNAFMNFLAQNLATLTAAGWAGHKVIHQKQPANSNIKNRRAAPTHNNHNMQNHRSFLKNANTRELPIGVQMTPQDIWILKGVKPLTNDEFDKWWNEELNGPTRKYLHSVVKKGKAMSFGDEQWKMNDRIRKWIKSRSPLLR